MTFLQWGNSTNHYYWLYCAKLHVAMEDLAPASPETIISKINRGWLWDDGSALSHIRLCIIPLNSWVNRQVGVSDAIVGLRNANVLQVWKRELISVCVCESGTQCVVADSWCCVVYFFEKWNVVITVVIKGSRWCFRLLPSSSCTNTHLIPLNTLFTHIETNSLFSEAYLGQQMGGINEQKTEHF